MRLRDGTEVNDPRLNRLVSFDEASKDFPIRTMFASLTLRSYTWSIPGVWRIDQGTEGSCVGHAIVNELHARPASVAFENRKQAERFAFERIYWEAQREDEWPGGSYPDAAPRYDGTSVLAGMKVAQRLGYFREYRWAFGLQDLVHGLGRNGPAVLGINWHRGMYTPVNAWVRPTGSVVGGHAILARSVQLSWLDALDERAPREWDNVDLDASYVVLRNSWGVGWGDRGDAKITLRDLDRLLIAQGEAVFAVGRKSVVRRALD
jgi:hypothetical protein